MPNAYEERQARIARDKAKVLRRYPDAHTVYLGPKSGTVLVTGYGADTKRLCTAFGSADPWGGAALHIVEA